MAPGLEPRLTPSGTEVFVDSANATRGSAGPFHAAYLGDDGRRRYGWFCSNCGSVDTAMDPMERIVCHRCGNRRKAVRWDAAYL